jgi:replicative DNA helicase
MANELELYGKLPPQALDLEDAILGAMMVDSSSLETVFEIIKTSDIFYKNSNAEIFKAIKTVHDRGGRVDFMTVIEELRKCGKMEVVGGSFYVTSLTRDVVSGANILDHAMIVRQKYMLRSLIDISGKSITKAYNDRENDVFELIEDLQSKLTSLTSDLQKSRIEKIGDAMGVAINESIENREKNVTLIGDSTGFRSLDEKIGGLINSDYIIIAAGTAEGKSTLAMNMAMNLAFEQNVPTSFFSLEMQNKQLAFKVLSNRLGIPVKKLRMGQISDEQVKNAHEVKSKFGGAPLYLNDEGGQNIEEICTTIRQLNRKFGVTKVFVDYLQLVGAEAPGRKTGMREQDVSYVSKRLRALSLELDICIIALSQLAEMEKGATRPYKLGDLRESKAIGHDATTVIFIWKPILPNQNRDIQNVMIGDIEFHATKHDALIICAKNRLDETGAIRFTDEFWASRFVEYAGNVVTPSEIYSNPSAGITKNTAPKITIDNDRPF